MEESNKDVVTNAMVEVGKEIYKDALSSTMKTIGTTLNNAVEILLAPVTGLCWGWHKIKECVISGLAKRFKNKKSENLEPPDPRIAVPIIQSLQYSANETDIREMFLNLLANDMDIENKKMVHPSFVEIVKQMSVLDAKLLKELSLEKGFIKAITPNIGEKQDSDQVYINVYPEWFLGYVIEGYDIFEMSASLLHLQKFGLIDLMFDMTAGNEGYDIIENSELLVPKLKELKKFNSEAVFKSTRNVVNINDYGKTFLKICL